METRTVLIDTSLFVEHLRARDKAATFLARIHEQRHRLVTSSIVVAELCYGVRTPALFAAVRQVLSPVQILSFTVDAALRVGVEVERLKSRNSLIGFRDLAIACAALESGLPVATHNRAEFGRMAGIELFDLTPA